MENKYLIEDEKTDFSAKAQTRAIDCSRVAKLARSAAEQAKANGNDTLAAKLSAEADELEEASKNWNISLLDSPEDEPEDQTSAKKPVADKGDESDDDDDSLDDEDESSDDEEANSEETDDENATSSSSSTPERPNAETKSRSKNASTDDKTDSGSSDSADSGKGSQSSDANDGGPDESSQTSDSQVIDIFNDEAPAIDLDALTGGKVKQARQPTLQEIIDQLSELDDADRQDALAGLQELLGQAQESLTEAFGGKSLRELSDDEFADGINRVLDLIDKVKKPDYVDPNEKKERIAKIQKLATDPYANAELKKEDDVEIQKDYQKKKARDQELQRYGKYRSIADFKINFYRAIRDQVEAVEDEEDTYMRINAPAEDTGIIRPGSRFDDLPGDVPNVDMYFDMSSSWTDNAKAIQIGKEAVATIKQFADRGEIKLNVYYFSDIITTDINDPRLGRSTDAWPHIIQQIKADGAKNVVLMTDRDMESDAAKGPTCVVDGEVWFIWFLDMASDYRTGGTHIPQHLQGKRGNHQYAFEA